MLLPVEVLKALMTWLHGIQDLSRTQPATYINQIHQETDFFQLRVGVLKNIQPLQGHKAGYGWMVCRTKINIEFQSV